MCHELLTQCALFVLESMKKGHAESTFRDACRTSSGSMPTFVSNIYYKIMCCTQNFWLSEEQNTYGVQCNFCHKGLEIGVLMFPH